MSTTTTTAPTEAEAVPAEALTELERFIAKSERRLVSMKHIDARDLAINFMLPIIKRMAKEQGDHAEDIGALQETLEGQTVSEEIVDTLETVKVSLGKMGDLLTRVLVIAGFYEVVAGVGIRPTDKIPADIRAEYEALGPELVELAVDIERAIELAQEEPDDGDPPPDPDGGEHVNPSAAVDAVDPAPATSTSKDGAHAA